MENRDELVVSNMNLVYSTINKYYPTYIRDDDIKQAGMMGLVKAANTWDETKSKFSTYAVKCILTDIRMEFRSRCKHPSNMYSLDYEMNSDDGSKTPFGELIAGQEDIDFVDIGSIYKKLTPREKEIFELKRSGMSNYEISETTGHSYQIVSRALRKVKMLLKN